MKVLSHGKEYWVVEHECSSCGARLQVESTDVTRQGHIMGSMFFQCPECKTPQWLSDEVVKSLGLTDEPK